MTRNIDELNNLTTKAVEPEKYFGEMELNEEQFERRVEYTKKANELFDVILILLLTMRDNGNIDYVYARGLLESWLLSLIAEYTTPDSYLIDYATDTAYNFVDTTKNHIEEDWYTSSDRALYNAENSANDVLNYDEYQQAIKDGKTHKKWITEKDNKVRKTHKALEGNTIPIKDFFRVGLARMRFPKDYEYADTFPEELVNCRCQIEYIPQKEAENNITEEQNTNADVRQEEYRFITEDFIRESTPGIGTISKEKGYKESNNETGIAKWLLEKFGGSITLLADNNPDGELNPDYIWNGKIWDLKSPVTDKMNTLKKRVKHGVEQIAANPGGVIVDLSKSTLGSKDVIEVLHTAERIDGLKVVKGTKFIIKKNDEIEVFTK